MSGTEVIQVIVPCIAVPLFVGVLLLVVHLWRRRRASAAGVSIKPPQASRRQHGAPSVAANNAVGLYSERLYSRGGGSNFLCVGRGLVKVEVSK